MSQTHRYHEEPSYEVLYCEGCGSADDTDLELKICEVCKTKGANRMAVAADDREFLQVAGIETYGAETVKLATASHFARLLTETRIRGLLPPHMRSGTTDCADGEE